MQTPFWNRIHGLIFHPSREFETIAVEDETIPEITRRYLIPLAVLAPLATLIGMNSFDSAWDRDQGYRVAKELVINTSVVSFSLEIASVFLIGSVFWLLTSIDRTPRDFRASMKVAIYGAVPLMVAGVTLFVPMNVFITMIAMIHSFALYVIGAEKVIGIHQQVASVFVAVAMTIVFGASTLAGAWLGSLGVLG